MNMKQKKLKSFLPSFSLRKQLMWCKAFFLHSFSLRKQADVV